MLSSLSRNRIAALILDMDGTLVRGEVPLPGIQNLFKWLRTRQLPFIIATNNATKSAADYQRELAGHGVELLEKQILTAGFATAQFLKSNLRPRAKLYMIGQPALADVLKEAGFILVKNASEPVTAVVIGGDSSLTYDKLKNAALHLQRGAHFIGTNPDLMYPTEEGLVPEAGTTLAALQAATGIKPTIIGKPDPFLFESALKSLQSHPGETAVIGDRLETDILGGQRAGLQTILITTGIDNAETISEKKIFPDWVVTGLDDLVELLKRNISLIDQD